MAAASPATRRPGFSIPGYAAAAARKGHQLKLCRQWTPEEARRMSEQGVAARRRPKEEQNAGA
jgi:hypothetical protein